MLVRYTVNVM